MFALRRCGEMRSAMVLPIADWGDVMTFSN